MIVFNDTSLSTLKVKETMLKSILSIILQEKPVTRNKYNSKLGTIETQTLAFRKAVDIRKALTSNVREFPKTTIGLGRVNIYWV